MIPAIFINPFSIMLSLSTMFGVFIHDTKIDQMTVVAMAVPAIVASYELGSKAINMGEAHTHSERASLSQMVRSLNHESPRTTPRKSEDKKHLLQKHVARGCHAFDSYFLPID